MKQIKSILKEILLATACIILSGTFAISALFIAAHEGNLLVNMLLCCGSFTIALPLITKTKLYKILPDF